MIVRGGRHLVARRRTGGLLGGLWEFPAGERNPGETWTAALCRVLAEAWGLSAVPGPCLLSARHEFSHLRWAVRVYRAELSNDLEPVCAPGYDRLCWVSAEELARLPFPSVYRELVAGLQADGA
ncbi:MAG: NUDIX domain-containing protein [Clostridia bacterium]|nr:NUDIX domain-containing protein [Clostridia bacterium]